MTKVKEKLYEHRFGLFFFLFLMLYSFVVSTTLYPWKVSNFSFSFYVVDFSLGFCSKLLPGAIFNLLFDNLTEEKVSAILACIICAVFFVVSMLLEKAYKRVNEQYKKTLLIIIAFFLTGPITFSKYFDLFCWLDVFWLIAAAISLICLSRKELYIFIIPLMLCAIMAHYGAILCYVPFIAVLILYRLSEEDSKKIKAYISVIWVILVAGSLFLALYLIINETKNIKVTMDELKSFFADRGVTDGNYFYYAFFRTLDTSENNEYFIERFGDLITVDKNQHPVVIFIQTILQQIQVTLKLSAVDEEIREVVIAVPAISFVYWMFIKMFKSEKNNKLKKFSIFCFLCLFIVVVVFGLFLSTDGARWIAHGFLPLCAVMIYIMQREEDFALKVKEAVNRVPKEIIIIYFMIYACA